MRVLRDNRDSVMAMLEAFVYDPLISWRLLTQNNNDGGGGGVPLSRSNSLDLEAADRQKSPVDKMRDQLSASPMMSSLNESSEQELTMTSNSPLRLPAGATSIREMPGPRRGRAAAGEPQRAVSSAPPTLSTCLTLFLFFLSLFRALEVINRIQAKLTGRDFVKAQQDDSGEDLTVEQQVARLVREATSVENLCQLFTGWCPLW